MKIKLCLKDPDGVYESQMAAVRSQLSEISALSEKERDLLMEARLTELQESMETWVKWNEYVSIEIDTETRTATVLKQR